MDRWRNKNVSTLPPDIDTCTKDSPCIIAYTLSVLEVEMDTPPCDYPKCILHPQVTEFLVEISSCLFAITVNDNHVGEIACNEADVSPVLAEPLCNLFRLCYPLLKLFPAYCWFLACFLHRNYRPVFCRQLLCYFYHRFVHRAFRF